MNNCQLNNPQLNNRAITNRSSNHQSPISQSPIQSPITDHQSAMTGVLLLDKPSGPTSHDVVARMRRATGERSIGHTGTLDPRASGLLPLVLGRATRLASLLTGSEKTYEAVVRLGQATSTDDAEGEPVGAPATARPDDAAIAAVLDRFRGTFDQVPPRHSAKKVGGRKAYELARADRPVELAPVEVTVSALEWLGRDGDLVRLRVSATAGFYVRALARDIGAALGCGAHLAGLRRTRSGHFDVADALPLEQAEAEARQAREEGSGAFEARLIAPAEALPHLPAVTLTEAGLKRVVHGNPVGPDQLEGRFVPPASGPGPVRVLGADGRLVALAHARGGALHPVVVLG
ncbi:MAG: tRNA pseudouridine(55) synthase TruB [Vicinamibacterales bacterium]